MSIATINQFAKRLASLPRVAAERVAEKAASVITDLGRETFANRQDAYGTSWVPGADGGSVDLVDSGSMRDRLRYIAIGTKVRSELGVSHAKFQVGKRPVYPRGVLPSKYSEALSNITAEVCREELRQ